MDIGYLDDLKFQKKHYYPMNFLRISTLTRASIAGPLSSYIRRLLKGNCCPTPLVSFLLFQVQYVTSMNIVISSYIIIK